MTSLIALLALSTSSFAADAYNAHGFSLVPSDSDVHDLLGTWRAETQVQGSFGVEGLFEYAEAPLIQYQSEGGEVTGAPLLDDLFGLNVGASWAPHERLALSAAMPVWFTSTDANGEQSTALGDVRVAAPIGLILAEDGGFSMSVVPFANLPSGRSDLYLGSGGVGGGGVVALGYGGDRFQISANVGGEITPTAALENLAGGPFVRAAGGASYEIIDGLALRGEVVYNAAIGGNDIPFTESPGEALASVRGRGDKGLSWTVGGATALTRGAGAAAFRAFAGAGFTFGKDTREDPPLRPQIASLTIAVRDTYDRPIDDATVFFDGSGSGTAGDGTVHYADLAPGMSPLITVSADDYEPETIDDLKLQPGENRRIVILDTDGSILKIIALDEHGAPIDARVRFLGGPADHAVSTLGRDGEETFGLQPGTWDLLIAAGEHVPVDATVWLDPGEFETLTVRFTGEEAPPVCTDTVAFHDVHFDFDIDTPRPEAEPVLRTIAATLKDCPDVVVQVGGHTDWIGSDIYNVDLSQRRMGSVKEILVDYGVPAWRLIPVGFGEAMPIATNETDEGRAQNRRVEFTPLNKDVASAE